MTIDQYRKFIDATLLAAAIQYIPENFAAEHTYLQQDIIRIVNQYNFQQNSPNTDKFFAETLLRLRQKFKDTKPDIQTKFYFKRFYNIAI